jgi:hypothetical protein
MDGAELGKNDLWDYPDPTQPVTGAAAAGFTGTYYWSAANQNYKLITARTSYYFGVRCKFTAAADVYIFNIEGNNGNTNLGTLTLPSDGFLSWNGGSGGPWRGSMLIPLNVAVRVEMYILRNTYTGAVANSDGAVTVKVNGIIVIQQTNIKSVEANYNIDCFGVNTHYDGSNEMGYDDVICVQDAWPGNIRIQKSIPEGSGTNTQWDASAGSNFDCVNEIPYSDTDFVSTNVNDEIDTYVASDLVEGTNPIDSILAVQLSARAKLEGSPTPQDIQLAVKSSSSYGYSANQQVQEDTYAWFNHVYNTDPATSAVWLKAAVNAMEIGVKAKARP